MPTSSAAVPDGGRVGIMQPYFFPYLGHFALISNVDRWVVFDVTQYTPKTWMNRNRVLHPTAAWMYLTVPVQGSSQSKLVHEVMLHEPAATLTSLLGKLAHYRRRAPHFDSVVGLVERAFAEREGEGLAALDVAGLRVVSEYLGVPFDFRVCSEMGLDLSDVRHPGQWALRIAEQVGASEYLNPVSGARLFDPAEFEASGIRLRFVDLPPMSYDTAPYDFVPSLSVLDVLMWNDARTVREFIHRESRVLDHEDVAACQTTSH